MSISNTIKQMFWLLLLPVTLLIYCSKPEKDEPVVIDIDSSLKINKSISPRDLLDEVQYIKLKANDDFYLTEAKKILELNGLLFILDKNKRLLACYTKEGDFISLVGKKGKGPTELQSVYDFEIDYANKRILVFSSADQAILEFDEDLNFISKKRFSVWSSHFSILKSGNLGFYSYYEDPKGNILFFDREGRRLGATMDYPQDKQLLPMDYTGFINGDFYSYPLSGLLYKVSEDLSENQVSFQIKIPDMRPEEEKFDHEEFLHSKFLHRSILSTFEIGAQNQEVLFFYSFLRKGEPSWTLGVRLKDGSVFSHRNMRHGYSSLTSDAFQKLFFTSPYNLPSYSHSSGYYYHAATNESIYEFFQEYESNLEALKSIDSRLSTIIENYNADDDPIIISFKLKDSY